ncbi:MAG TPA: hypothetical protein VE596_15350 [Gaiellaceae bacterium]|nr:hypothetical protein [Gaiellaceae bacterium]
MRLEPLYVLRFRYSESYRAGDERLLLAEGEAHGRVTGRFQAANRARRRPDGSYLPTLNGAIETEDGAAILLTLVGYGAPYAEPEGRVVAAVLHTAEGEHAWLNDVLGVVAGAVRDREVVLEVAELVWEPIGE